MQVSLLRGDSVAVMKETVKEKVPGVVTTGWRFWPFVHIFTYFVVPPRHRVLWVSHDFIRISVLFWCLGHFGRVLDVLVLYVDASPASHGASLTAQCCVFAEGFKVPVFVGSRVWLLDARKSCPSATLIQMMQVNCVDLLWNSILAGMTSAASTAEAESSELGGTGQQGKGESTKSSQVVAVTTGGQAEPKGR